MPSLLQRFLPKKVPLEQGALFTQVMEAMEDVREYARSHGGEIELIGVTDGGEVTVKLHGACKTCPIAAITLKVGVEERLRILVPGIKKVKRL